MRRLARLLVIATVFFRHGLDEMLFAGRPWVRLLPGYWRRKHLAAPGVRLRLAFEDLGPVFVKLGQLLSVRPDLIPAEIAQELAALRDRVPPFPGEQAARIVERGYGRGLDEVFARFELEPLASASIAQVHAAALLDGREVVVKVVRPGIEATIGRDLALMAWLGRTAERLSATARRLRPSAVVAVYERIIRDELDMLREAACASQFRRNFEGSALLTIPAVHWEHTRQHVLVLDRIAGIAIDDLAGLESAGIDLQRLAERGVEIFFTQVFRHNFFHADMHPGNIFVAMNDPPAAARYIAIDFGIVGVLSPDDQRYLAENFLAFFNRDYRRVAELHVASRWVPAHTRVEEFEMAIRSVCEPIFQRPLRDISFGQLLVRLFQTARRFEMEVQPQLVLLQKTLLHIEGLGRQLYPDLNLWITAKPFLEQWLRERSSTRHALRELLAAGPQWVALLNEFGPQLPVLAAAELRSLARRRREPAPPPVRARGWPLAVGLLALGAGWLAGAAQGWLPYTVPGWLMLGAGCGWLLRSSR